MSRFQFVATAGAGGDTPPLIAAAIALTERGHEVRFVGDRGVQQLVAGIGLDTEVLPPQLDLGPRLAGAIREAMTAFPGDLAAAGRHLQNSLGVWAAETSALVADSARRMKPDALVTSLFGVEVVHCAANSRPWAVVNSTFYIGPDPPRPLEDDFSPRARPLVQRFASLLHEAAVVLHATDWRFDYSFEGFPSNHRYVGALGLWEPKSEVPSALAEPGDPWVLVSLSTQQQDDVPLARAAITALASHPVRVLVTVGEHDPAELETPPKNALVVGFVPHSAVLARSRLLVSHSGHGSVMKGIWHGCPMVLVPWGRDQPGVAARAAALGLATVLARENLTESAMSDAIETVLTSSAMARVASEHSRRMQATDPHEAAAAAIESVV